MNQDAGSTASSNIVQLDVQNARSLYPCYMPFISNGGLFIAQRHLNGAHYELGSEIFVLLNLVDANDRLPLAGRVVWITPRGAQRPQGIGLQFSPKDGGATRRRLEALLQDYIGTDQATHTL